MTKISILLIEDNRLLREGIAAMINKESDMEVIYSTANGENVENYIELHNPSLILLDLGLRSDNSVEVVRKIKGNYPDIKIIVMDLVPVQEDLYEYVQAGVSGFTLKDVDTAEFFKTIRAVAAGEKILPSILTESLFSRIINEAIKLKNPTLLIDSIRITKRERQVVELISDGATNKEIAQKLHLSTYTIKSHVHNILEKLSLNTRLQVANYARTSESFRTSLLSTSSLDD